MTLSLYLSRIIFVRILFAWAILVLLGLSIDLFKSASGLIETGGGYAVFEYAYFRTPQIMVVLFTVAILVGSITAFLALGHHSELIIMRASGHGIFLILGRLVPLMIILGVAHSQLGDRVTSWSETGLAAAFPEDDANISSDKWLWGRDGGAIIRAQLAKADGSVLDKLTVFEIGKTGQIVSRMNAKQASYNNQVWVLADAVKIQNGVAEPSNNLRWDTQLVPKTVLEIATKKRNFSASDARAALAGDTVVVRSSTYYVTRIKRNYAAFAVPLVLMTITALAGFGSTRGGNGAKLAIIAVVLGFSYITIDGMVGSLGEIGAIEPNIAAFSPSILFAAIGVWALLLLDE